MANHSNHGAYAALQWYLDNGVDEALADSALDRTVFKRPVDSATLSAPAPAPASLPADSPVPQAAYMGAAEATQKARAIAASCQTLEDLEQAVKDFDGLSIKKTATQCVFSDGNPAARLMLVGEAPGADEDRQGKPFVGQSGQLLDKILAAAGFSRFEAEDAARAIYIANVLNWRPPGNRTPSPAEIEMSLPFIERHIALIKPDFLILCGGVAAKALLNSADSISKLRGKMHDIRPGDHPCRAMATYHPAYLLRTPAQKAKVWADMLYLKRQMRENS